MNSQRRSDLDQLTRLPHCILLWPLIVYLLLRAALLCFGLSDPGAMVGAARVLRQPPFRNVLAVLLLVCAAQVGVVFVSGIVRRGHRTPLEPVLAALAVAAVNRRLPWRPVVASSARPAAV